MYGEDREFLERTLEGVHKNLRGFKKLGVENEQIVVVVIQDGIMKMQNEMEDYFTYLDEQLNFSNYENTVKKRK